VRNPHTRNISAKQVAPKIGLENFASLQIRNFNACSKAVMIHVFLMEEVTLMLNSRALIIALIFASISAGSVFAMNSFGEHHEPYRKGDCDPLYRHEIVYEGNCKIRRYRNLNISHQRNEPHEQLIALIGGGNVGAVQAYLSDNTGAYLNTKILSLYPLEKAMMTEPNSMGIIHLLLDAGADVERVRCTEHRGAARAIARQAMHPHVELSSDPGSEPESQERPEHLDPLLGQQAEPVHHKSHWCLIQ
jgi:hypothetical protein